MSHDVEVVVHFILGLNFYFLLFLSMVMYDNGLKQKKIKFKARIKLNHNIDNCDVVKTYTTSLYQVIRSTYYACVTF